MPKAKTIIMVFYFVLALLMFSAIGCSQDRMQNLIKQGNEVAAKVEDYKAKKGMTPDSLADVGVEERLEGPIFYEKKSNTEYRLWFGTDLGESVVYNSATHKWE